MKENIIKYTEWSPVYEFQIPNVKLDEFLYNIKIAVPKYTKTITEYYRTYNEYVDLIDKKKHQYNINDLSGDILGNERVKFKAMIFDKDDLENIQENFVTYALSDFYSELPDSLNILGINVKPLSFINKDAVKFTFQQTITFETAISVITQLSDMAYEGEHQGYYIWSTKNNQKLTVPA